METSAPKKKRIWLPLLLVLLVLGLAAGAIIVLLGGDAAAGRYLRDADELLSSYDPAGFAGASLEPDGTLTLRLTREDLYWFADRYRLLRADPEPVPAARGVRVGFRIADGKLVLFHQQRLLGLLSVTARGETELRPDPDGGGFTLSVRSVSLGRHMHLPSLLWPEYFCQEIHLALNSAYGPALSAELEGDALRLCLPGLRDFPGGELNVCRERTAAMQFLGLGAELPEGLRGDLSAPDDPPALGEADWQAALAAGDAGETLPRLLAACTAETVSRFRAGTPALLREQALPLLEKRTEELRRTWDSALNEEQANYERLLTAVREIAKSGALVLGETAPVSPGGEPLHPGVLSRLPATATDSRFVFLYSLTDPEELCPGELPEPEKLPLADRSVTAPAFPPGIPCDLGAVLTTAGDRHLLVYRRGDGTLVLRQIDETVYVSLLVERGIPVFCIDQLPSPVGRILRPAGEGWTGAELLISQ